MKKADRQKIYEKYNGHCAYCGEEIEYSKMQADHIHPKYLGGKDDIENYNPACRECNFYKSTFSIEGFRQRLLSIPERLNKVFIFRLALKYGIIKMGNFDGKFYFEKVNDEKL